MLTYSFSDIGTDTLYEHLYKCIKQDILSGVFDPGYKLPSKRNFAKNLGISTITIENAYEQLISEGYIYSVPKKGYYVADLKKSVIMAVEKTENWDVNLNIKDAEKKYFSDFTSNQTNSDNFPFSIWAKLIREILNDNRIDLMTNPPVGGIMYLRQAIAKHLKAFRGMNVRPEQIIVGAGTEYLYGLLIQLLGQDKKYAVEDPGYQKISKIYRSHNVICDNVPMDSKGIMRKELERLGTDIVHISPSHHFPTGMVMPVSRRYELLGWAVEAESRYIIEDDYDSEFRLVGQPIPTMQSIDDTGRVIYMNTFTKTLASTVRISYMVLPVSLLNIFYENLGFYSCTVSNFEQYTLGRFIEEGYFEKHLNRMRNYYCKKRDAMVRAIQESPLSGHAEIFKEDAGLHFLLKINTGLSDEEFRKRAEERGIRITALSQYYSEEQTEDKHIFVVNYTSVPEERMKETMERLCECL